MKTKTINLKTKDQKRINMNDRENNENIQKQPKDDRLKSFIERVERLEEEKSNILADIKEVYSEARSIGYDPKIMRKVLIIRKMDVDERLEQEALLDTYRNALGIF
jgi:uncharacterized protein (UPF0335 family)